MSPARSVLFAIATLWMVEGCSTPASSNPPVSPARAATASAATRGEQTTTFMLEPDGRIALATLERLDMVTAVEEASPGLLRLRLGNGWNRAAAEYHLSHLYNAYTPHLDSHRPVALELWQGDAKIGEYTADGLLIGPEFTTPR